MDDFMNVLTGNFTKVITKSNQIHSLSSPAVHCNKFQYVDKSVPQHS